MRRIIHLLIFILLITPLTGCFNKLTTKELNENIQLAEDYIHNNNYAEAKAIYENLLEQNDKLAQAYIGLANIFMLENKQEEAESTFKKGIEKSDDKNAVRNHLADFYLKLAKFSEAEKEYKLVLENDPKNEHALIKLSELVSNLGRPEEALELVVEAVRLDPQLTSTYVVLDRLARQGTSNIGDYAKSLLAKNSEDKAAILLSIYDSFYKEDYPKVVSLSEKLKGDNPKLTIMLALSYYLSGDEQNAEKTINRIDVAEIEDYTTLKDIFFYYEKIGEMNQAIKVAEKAHSLNEGNPELYLYLYEKTHDEKYLNELQLFKWKFTGEENEKLTLTGVNEDDSIYAMHSYTSGYSEFEEMVHETKIYHINAEGKLAWEHENDVYSRTLLTPSLDQSIFYKSVFHESSSGILYKIGKNGTEEWNTISTTRNPVFGRAGAIYVGGSEDGDYFLQALSPNGEAKWRFPVDIPTQPAVGEDGTIYVGTTVNELEGTGDIESAKFYALNPDGTEKWSFAKSGYYSEPVLAPNGNVIFSVGNYSEQSKLYGFTPSGEKAFEFIGDYNIYSILSSEKYVYFVGNKSVYAIDYSGTLQWTYELSGYGAQLYTVEDDTLYLIESHKLTALDQSGTKKWQHVLTNTEDITSLEVKDNGLVYLTSYNVADQQSGLTVLAMNENADGSYWFLPFGEGFSSVKVGLNDVVYVSSQNRIYALNEMVIQSISQTNRISNPYTELRFRNKDYQNWVSKWSRPVKNNSAILDISEANELGFPFEINASWQAHSGYIAGQATFVSKNEAVFEDENKCKVTFKMTNSEELEIQTTDTCSYYGGLNVTFFGNYQKGIVEPEASLVWVFDGNTGLDEQFKKLVGDDYEMFDSFLASVNEITNLDDFEAKGVQGFVTGVAGFANAIIMYNDSGQFWAATINGSNVHYHTNDPNYKDKLPKTIQDWYDTFLYDQSIVYMD